jgi:hypothetical protein
LKTNLKSQPKTITPNDTSMIGKILGDGVSGSSWRAAEQAMQPDVEVRVYVRSLAEAMVTLDMTITFLAARRLMPLSVVQSDTAMNLAKKYDALVAIELTNGSVVIIKKEAGT